MKIVALYDIHSNLPALDAVLQEVEQEHPDLILVGGDMVPGPMPRATLERLLSLGANIHFIRGNCEREVVAAFDGLPLRPGMSAEVSENMRWTVQQLERTQRDFMAQLPEQATFNVDGLGEVLFCHGSPRSDEEIFTVATPEERMRDILAPFSASSRKIPGRTPRATAACTPSRRAPPIPPPASQPIRYRMAR